jgi:hypothetical protein
MMHHSDLPKRSYSPLPYSLVSGDEFVGSVGEKIFPGVTYLPEKADRYRTTHGIMSLADLNKKTREFTPRLATEKFRYLDDNWVKYHYDSKIADDLYHIDQQYSRRLINKGAGLSRDDIEVLTDETPFRATKP